MKTISNISTGIIQHPFGQQYVSYNTTMKEPICQKKRGRRERGGEVVLGMMKNIVVGVVGCWCCWLLVLLVVGVVDYGVIIILIEETRKH